jgi:peptidoglycan/xylan/chitin deacetylase (PgdA/CDA1 family)
MYHRIDPEPSRFSVGPESFEQQIAELAARGQARLTLRDARSRGDQRAVVVTCDDGTSDTFQVAWPLLRRYGRTATVFLISDLIGGMRPGASGPIRMMDWGQVREMAQEGVEFGSHTATHLDLRQAEVGLLRRELQRSKAAIEEQIGTEVVSFAYPFGYFRTCMPELLAEAGYKWAVLGGTYGSNRSATRPYELRRIPVEGGASLRAWRWGLGPACDLRYYTEKVRQELAWHGKQAGRGAAAEQTHGR